MYFEINSLYLNCCADVGVTKPNTIEHILIFLHGRGGSFMELTDNMPLKEYADKHNVLIVMPNMDSNFYIDRTDYRPGMFITEELIPEIRRMFNTDADAHIAGISMGGFGSVLIGFNYPEYFKSVTSISGAFLDKTFIEVRAGDTNIFATWESFDDIPEKSPFAAVKQVDAGKAPNLVITCGNSGAERSYLYGRNKELLELLDGKKINYHWKEIDGGDHDFDCFRKGMEYAFSKIF